MSAAPVTLIVDRGEDFTAQIVWTDEYDEPMKLAAPARLDAKGAAGANIIEMATAEVPPPEGDISPIEISEDIGLIQLHIPKEQTALLTVGSHAYDLFCTVDDGTRLQVNRIMAGPFIVQNRITEM